MPNRAEHNPTMMTTMPNITIRVVVMVIVMVALTTTVLEKADETDDDAGDENNNGKCSCNAGGDGNDDGAYDTLSK